ncbi:hypothetical protein L5515_017787 [Caenorhabditis briggsae]|uniref:Uncharacterized protein n=1 Tax=Caenorhabditis briggsae TaxID=6238 RepID=A0AAE9JS09_CAEBR|nr:hypothetical protein L3Y34_011925 [Caenorhabditis briggsae]UMM41590.1 hypothetical protein L5515_017787 [Caenorhabditis briggsae]
MSQENKSNNLKRGYPEAKDGEQEDKETHEVITDVISILRNQENSGFAVPLPVVKGSVPPPNTPCSKD